METLTEGAEGYFVRRYGKQTDSTFVAGDIVNVYAVRVGMSAKVAIAANSILRSKVNFSVRAPGWAENEGRLIHSSRIGLSFLSPARDPLFSLPQ